MFITPQSNRKNNTLPITCRREARQKLLQHINLNKGEKNIQPLEIQRSVICEKLDPKLALRERRKGSFRTGFSEGCREEPLFSDEFSFNHFSTQTATVKPAESPSRSRPGTPRCCCAGSLMGVAVLVSWTEAASQLLCLRVVSAVLFEVPAPACAGLSSAAVLQQQAALWESKGGARGE